MIVVLTREYKCAPEGHTTIAYKEGEEVTGVVAEMALADKAGREKQKKTPKPKYTKPAKPNDEG